MTFLYCESVQFFLRNDAFSKHGDLRRSAVLEFRFARLMRYA